MELQFRNIDATPDDPVETWGVEGILTAMERGGSVHARRIMAAVKADPHGKVAQDLEQALELTDAGTSRALRLALPLVQDPNKMVAWRLNNAVRRSGLNQTEFAREMGTSQSRMSTYLSGKTCPSAAFLVRAEALADRVRAQMPSEMPGLVLARAGLIEF